MSEVDLAIPGNPTPEPVAAPVTASEPVNISFPDNWKDALENDIKGDPSLAAITDIKALAKSYVHGQRLIGADKIIIPGKNATPEDWAAIYKKLGVPETSDKYDVKVDGLDEKTLTSLKAEAHKLGVLPKQLQGVAEFIKNQQAATFEDSKNQFLTDRENDVKSLKAEWGDKFDVNLDKARRALSAFADQETITYMGEMGLSSDIRLVKLFAKIADGISEDKFNFEPSSALGTSKSQAQSKIETIMSDTKSPYYDATHPGHEAAVREMQMLNNIIYN